MTTYTYNFKASVANKPKLYEPIVFKDPTGLKKDKRRPIIYRFLYDLSELEDNHYYQTLFIEMSTGKFPYGYSYEVVDDTLHKLIYKKRSTFYSCALTTKDPKAAINAIKDFMRKYTLVQSYEEKEKSEDTPAQETITWFKISRKIKEQKMYLDMYTKQLADELKLSTSEIEDLKNTLDHAKLVGYLTDQHVVFENGKISDIKGLSFNDKKRCFELDMSTLQISTRSNKSKEDDNTPSSNICIDGFRAFIRELKKDAKGIKDSSKDIDSIKDSNKDNSEANTDGSITVNDDESIE